MHPGQLIVILACVALGAYMALSAARLRAEARALTRRTAR